DLKEQIYKFNLPVFHAEEGFEVVRAEFAEPVKNPAVKAPSLQVSADRKKVTLTGEMEKPQTGPPVWNYRLALTQQRAGAPTLKRADAMAVNVMVPGTTTVPLPTLPPGWVVKGRKVGLVLEQDGRQVAWKEGDLPRNAAVQLSQAAMVLVNAAEQGN